MCGVVGIWGHPEAAKLTYLGLHALQHRGQEAAGIVSAHPDQPFTRHVGRGLVSDIFGKDALARLDGPHALGHVRYSTTGLSETVNAQPFRVKTARGELALAHNGNIVNEQEVRTDLEHRGSIFTTGSDTEVLLHLLAHSRAPRLADRIREAAAQVEGAYSLVLLTDSALVGVRDPSGYRPLWLGRVGEAYVLVSETSALSLIEGIQIREIEPGEIVTITDKGVHSERLVHDPNAPAQSCIFELVYFSRPDSFMFGQSVYEARFDMGRKLAAESPANADVVIAVPDSGIPAALGYADASGIPYKPGLIRSHYVGRTFIEPEQSIRNFGVKLKLSAVRAVLEGKRVVVVDDSIVRGTTSRKIVKILRDAGAVEVHIRISSPPSRFPCYYGINTPTQKELIAAKNSVEEVGDYITADSLSYISLEGLHQSVGDLSIGDPHFCNACFSGNYTAGAPTIRSRLAIVH
ncbi:MAG: amidophosphoribosyltransferase [Myxococcales bacterium]|nr:amidophosphoribosyltransferase [Myxococcales bacterium]